jgi:hypothetical protein
VKNKNTGNNYRTINRVRLPVQKEMHQVKGKPEASGIQEVHSAAGGLS